MTAPQRKRGVKVQLPQRIKDPVGTRRDELTDEIDDAVAGLSPAMGFELVSDLLESLELRRSDFENFYGKRLPKRLKR